MRQMRFTAVSMPILCLVLYPALCGPAFGQAQPATPPTAVKKGFVGDISDLTEKNSNFRRVLYTGKYMQLVVMSLKPGEDIGEEVHSDVDQFFRFEEGAGEVSIEGVRTRVKDDYAVLVPAGAKHNVINTGDRPLRFYTIYGPPEHKDKTEHATKQEAIAREQHYDGKPSE